MNNDIKERDFMDKEFQCDISKMHLVLIFVSSLLITFIYQFKIKGYFYEAILPFIIILGNYLLLFKDMKKKKPAHFLIIPIGLVAISDLIVGICDANKVLNMIILPFMIIVYLFLLIGKDFHISGRIFSWPFKLVPLGLLTNLKHLKIKSQSYNMKKFTSIITGIGFGLLFGIVILYLLSSADDYFSALINNLFYGLVNFDGTYFIILTCSFILTFSVYINFLKHQDDLMRPIKVHTLDKTIVITFLTMVNSIFVLFLISEISRLTSNFLALPIEYTYSSYAREGFFELLFVTLINYGIIMFMIYKTGLIRKNKVVKLLVILLIIFSCLLIFNSYYRMYLYINHYGFTILRLQVILFLLMELVLFILMGLRCFNYMKKHNALIYFIICISFYLLNLYLCNDTFLKLLGY